MRYDLGTVQNHYDLMKWAKASELVQVTDDDIE